MDMDDGTRVSAANQELLELLKLLTSKKRGLLFQAFKPGDLLLELRFVF